jgi:hypothetical protein
MSALEDHSTIVADADNQLNVGVEASMLNIATEKV